MSVGPTPKTPFSTPVNLGPSINSETLDVQPNLSADGTILVFASDRPGGLGGPDLWMTPRVPKAGTPPAIAAQPQTELLTSPDFVWSEPENLGPTVNGPADQSLRSLTNDELRLYFHRKGGADSKADELCEVARTSRDAPFGEPRVVGNGSPYVSGDGLTLVNAGPDISMRQRPSLDAPFGEAINLGPVINSPGDERNPRLSPDGLALVFASNRDIPQHPELWMSRRTSQADAFGPPTKFGPAVNDGKTVFGGVLLADGQTLLFRRSAKLHLAFTGATGAQSALELRDHPFADNGYGDLTVWFAPEGTPAYFSADRPGGLGGQDIYVTRRVPKSKGAAVVPAATGTHVDVLPSSDTVEIDRQAAEWRYPWGAKFPFSAKANR